MIIKASILDTSFYNKCSAEREELIREMSDKHAIKDYTHSPLERDTVVGFTSNQRSSTAKV